MTKKYTSQDRPPWPQTHIILPLTRSSRGLHSSSFTRAHSGWSAAAFVRVLESWWPFAEPLFPPGATHLTPLCPCLPSCGSAAAVNKTPSADLADVPKGFEVTHELMSFALHLGCSGTANALLCVTCAAVRNKRKVFNFGCGCRVSLAKLLVFLMAAVISKWELVRVAIGLYWHCFSYPSPGPFTSHFLPNLVDLNPKPSTLILWLELT